MIRQVFILLLLTLSLSSNISGQQIENYEPLAFEDFEPKWIHEVYDSTAVGLMFDTLSNLVAFDGHTHIYTSYSNLNDPIIHDGYLYQITKTLFAGDLSGAIIEKIDLETGVSVWKSIFDFRQGYRETVEHAEIRGDTLLLFDVKMINYPITLAVLPVLTLGFTDSDEFKGVLQIRKYDIDTGDLLSIETADQDDSKVKNILPYGISRHDLEPIDEVRLLYTNVEFSADIGNFLIIDTIAYDGTYLNPTDTLYTEHELDWLTVEKRLGYKFLIENNGESIYWIDDYIRFNEQSVWVTETPYLTIKNEFGVAKYPLDFIGGSRTLNTLVGSDLGYVYILEQRLEGTEIELLHQVTSQGELVQSIDITGFSAELANVNTVNNITFDSLLTGRTIGSYGDYQFEFFEVINGERSSINSFQIGNPQNEVRELYTYPLDDGDYLFFVNQHFNNSEGSFSGRSHSIFRVCPDLIVSTLDQEPLAQTSTINIYPNPVSDKLYLESQKSIFSCTVYNTNGSVVYSRQTFSSNETIDCSLFQPGIYTIQIEFEDGIEFSRFVKV